MADKFVVRQKKPDKKEDKSIVMTLRLDRELQEEFDSLAAKSDRSRNELMCMALRYALDHLEFIPGSRRVGNPASFSCTDKKKTLPPKREKGIAVILLPPVSPRQSYK